MAWKERKFEHLLGHFKGLLTPKRFRLISKLHQPICCWLNSWFIDKREHLSINQVNEAINLVNEARHICSLQPFTLTSVTCYWACMWNLACFLLDINVFVPKAEQQRRLHAVPWVNPTKGNVYLVLVWMYWSRDTDRDWMPPPAIIKIFTLQRWRLGVSGLTGIIPNSQNVCVQSLIAAPSIIDWSKFSSA